MAGLGRSIEVGLSDGRAALLRDARPHDARALTRQLDAIAAEPRSGLLLEPGQRSARDWRRLISEAAERPGALFVVAEVGGELVGNLGLRPAHNRSSPHVGTIGISVAAPLRRLGLGGALLDTTLAWADGRYLKVELSVLGYNEGAVRFYERHGFSCEGRRAAQYVRGGEYHDEVLMARFLTTSSPGS